MLEIKKHNDNALITDEVHGIEYLDKTVANMVQYAKDIKALQAVDYEEFEFEDVLEWLYSGDTDLTPSGLARFAEFVQGAGHDDYDGYYVREYMYLYGETQNRLLDGQE